MQLAKFLPLNNDRLEEKIHEINDRLEFPQKDLSKECTFAGRKPFMARTGGSSFQMGGKVMARTPVHAGNQQSV